MLFIDTKLTRNTKKKRRRFDRFVNKVKKKRRFDFRRKKNEIDNF